MSKKISIYAAEPVEAVLKLHQDDTLSSRINSVCERYLFLINSTHLTTTFSSAELNSFVDCCLSTAFPPAAFIPGTVLADFADSLIDGLEEKWGINGTEVAEKLSRLSMTEEMALIEYIEHRRTRLGKSD